jgi:hypothetical protein
MWCRGWAAGALLASSLSIACGGTVTTVPGDAGSDTGPRDATTPLDAKSVDGPVGADGSIGQDVVTEAITKQPYDGTTGKPCTTNADCKAADGPGIAVCSSTFFAPDAYYPTAVCMLPSCSPASDEASLHYCDGPDDPSSPGICLPSADTGAGLCVPKCTYDTKGDPPAGCLGKDVCFTDALTEETGYGYCGAGCTQDGDCPSGQHCQTDRGSCLAGIVPPTKTIGQACTEADENDYACHCLYGGTSDTGYCSSFCIASGMTTCEVGYACDAIEFRPDGYTVQNPGMGGYCVATCATGDASACPPNSTCSDINVAGPDCIP